MGEEKPLNRIKSADIHLICAVMYFNVIDKIIKIIFMFIIFDYMFSCWIMLVIKLCSSGGHFRKPTKFLLVADEARGRRVSGPEFQALVTVDEDAVLLQCDLLLEGHPGVHQILERGLRIGQFLVEVIDGILNFTHLLNHPEMERFIMCYLL